MTLYVPVDNHYRHKIKKLHIGYRCRYVVICKQARQMMK
jgi:hypothetical protein